MLNFTDIKSSITNQLAELIILDRLPRTHPNLNNPLRQINLDILRRR